MPTKVKNSLSFQYFFVIADKNIISECTFGISELMISVDAGVAHVAVLVVQQLGQFH